MKLPKTQQIQHRKKLRICRMKNVFKDKLRAAWRARQLSQETNSRWRYYLCDECRKFHLTSH